MDKEAALTASDVVVLARIVEAAQGERMVRRVDSNAPDRRVMGTARHLVTNCETYARPSSDDDIRDCLLRVTLTSGLDVCWPISELVTQLPNSEAVFAN